MIDMKKVCFVISSPMSAVAYLTPHLKLLQSQYELTVATNTSDTDLLRRHGVSLDVLPLVIERPIRPLLDIRALWSLYWLFRQRRFDVVHSVTPKAGLLSMLAAWMARVPVRVHWFTGQVWANKRGVRRWGLKQADRIIAFLATDVLVDSPSQKEFLLAERVMSQRKPEVLGNGSICGVNADRFRPDNRVRATVRSSLRIPDSALVFLYVGRLNRDKGIEDLALAFVKLAESRPDVWLLLVGPDEEAIVDRVKTICEPWLNRVRFVGFTDQPENFMAASDVFCLPSYREGFGSVVIEAAACGIPAVASRIYGLTDAVDEGEGGLLHPPGDVAAIASQLDLLAGDEQLRSHMGEAARKRAVSSFSEARITNALREFYEKIVR